MFSHVFSREGDMYAHYTCTLSRVCIFVCTHKQSYRTQNVQLLIWSARTFHVAIADRANLLKSKTPFSEYMVSSKHMNRD